MQTPTKAKISEIKTLLNKGIGKKKIKRLMAERGTPIGLYQINQIAKEIANEN